MRLEGVADDVEKRVLACLFALRGRHGSVTVTVHCDPTGPKKVVVNTEEAMRLDEVNR